MAKILVYSTHKGVRDLVEIYFKRAWPDVVVDSPLSSREVIDLITPARAEDLDSYVGFLLEATEKEPLMLEVARDLISRYNGNSSRLRLLCHEPSILRRAKGAGMKTMYYPPTKRSCDAFIVDIEASLRIS